MNDVLRKLNRSLTTVSSWYPEPRDENAQPFTQWRTVICYDPECPMVGLYHRHTLPVELIDLLHDLDRWEYNLSGALRYRTP